MDILAYYLPKIKAVTWEEWLVYAGIMALLIAAVSIDKILDRRS